MSWKLDVSDEVVEQAVQGDRDATERLAQGLCGPIYQLAVRFFGDPAEAPDAAQEAVIQVLRVLPTFEKRSRFSTWCYRVVVNRFLNMKRRRFELIDFETGARSLARGLEHHADNGPYQGPEAQLLAEEVKLSCTSALLVSLSRPLRMAYVLGEILSMSAPEAASVLEIQPATFRKRLSLARARMRQFLAERCGLYDPAQSCRCDKQVGYDVKVGWVDPKRLRWAQKGPERTMHQLDETFSETALLLAHPNYPPPESLKAQLRRRLRSVDETLGADGDKQ